MKKRIYSLIIMAALCISIFGSIPAAATTVDVSDTTEHTSSVTVSAIVGSSYSVSIPADFALTKQNEAVSYNDTDYMYYGTYTVGAKGNIPVGDVITITPSALVLTDEDGAGSNDVPVTIVQAKTTWTRAELMEAGVIKNTYTTTTGYTYANFVFAGSYSGSLTFTYQLTTP